MLLSSKTQLGLAFDTYMQEQIFKVHYDKYIDRVDDLEIKTGSTRQIASILSNDSNLNYYFRNTAIEIAQRIKIDNAKLEDYSFLTKNLPDKKCTFLLGSDKFYRWQRWGQDILVMCVKLQDFEEKDKAREVFENMSPKQIIDIALEKRKKGVISDYDYNSIVSSLEKRNVKDLTKGVTYYTFGFRDGQLGFPQSEKNKDFNDEMMQFLRLLIFTELSELETEIIQPKQSRGTKKTGKILNESNQNVTIIDSTWNKILIKSDGFKVSGHLRLQRYGEQKSKVKLIYIDEFEKQGYTRTAKSIAN